MELETLLQFAVTLGLPSALTLYFVWRSDTREERMAKRIDLLEDFSRTQMVAIVDKTTAALIDATAASRDATAASRAQVAVMGEVKHTLQEHDAFARQLGDKIIRASLEDKGKGAGS